MKPAVAEDAGLEAGPVGDRDHDTPRYQQACCLADRRPRRRQVLQGVPEDHGGPLPIPLDLGERDVADVGAAGVALEPRTLRPRSRRASRSTPSPEPTSIIGPWGAISSTRRAISARERTKEGVAKQCVAPTGLRPVPGPVGLSRSRPRARGRCSRRHTRRPRTRPRSLAAPPSSRAAPGAGHVFEPAPHTSGKRSADWLGQQARLDAADRAEVERLLEPLSRNSKSPTSIASARGSSDGDSGGASGRRGVGARAWSPNGATAAGREPTTGRACRAPRRTAPCSAASRTAPCSSTGSKRVHRARRSSRGSNST